MNTHYDPFTKAVERTRILSQHLSPLIQEVFGFQSSPSSPASPHTTHHNLNIAASSTTSFDSINSNDIDVLSPWVHFCAKQLIEHDGFFSNFYEQHLLTSGNVKRASDLTADQLRMVLTLTLDFMDTGQITSDQIRRLMLSGAKIDTALLRERVLPQFSHLQEIDLSHTEATDNTVIQEISLNAADHLTSLNLAHTRVSDNGVNAFLATFARSSQLTHLDLSFTNITERTVNSLIQHLPTCESQLSLCNMEGIAVSQTLAVQLLRHFPHLQKLPVLNGTFVKFRDNVIVRLPNNDDATHTQRLDLSNSEVTAPILSNILSIYATPHLTTLSLHNVQSITLDEIYQLMERYAASLAHLRQLDISCVQHGNVSDLSKYHRNLNRLLPNLQITSTPRTR